MPQIAKPHENIAKLQTETVLQNRISIPSYNTGTHLTS